MDIYELLKWDVFKVNKVENGIYMDSSKSDWNPRVNIQLLEKFSAYSTSTSFATD
ncbi:hypothetical protein POX_g09189 [Penicillium oxalicum]|uniref:Uncharacterized protein n=1 Tax=Penicillium oxalicum (strain 114-2 / CGMCC 5302) TaxID=933388 RepID=S8AKY9_PENO1|nr:hypothetical protein POX_g09189 [Penicillium oxalicum]EPS26513.1 hypothetical protein PDE_01450 [Penicillium oxalicum 114-2]KAI2786795.1 hypothetical protein POX_g09189 [Penicillium oxalicum]